MLRLKKGREARARVHPWLFKGDVAEIGAVEPGEAVTVVDFAGHFVGRGFFNPRPALCCRLATWDDEALDEAFFARRIAAAVARRPDPALARLVWSEADGLPGLVVDRFTDVLVLQSLTLGTAGARATLVAALRRVVGDLPVLLADDATAARLEGFEPARGWVGREGPAAVDVREGPVTFRVRLGGGHKTGHYLDQRENRARVAALAAGRRVLDAFCYTAGFACAALVAGAREAVGIETSAEALAGARENLALNGVADRARLVDANAFDELRRLERERARFDLIVLDPPPFTRGRAAVEAAARGYKEINLRSMRLLPPGGLLATFSCSHHVTEARFEAICREAAGDAGLRLRTLATLGQAADHPVLLTVPETGYLKGLLLERV
ncbi:MAG: class I SAM-dependent rRNA methyltransferase [Candidatus Rokubacteria bacterium]|nr:class I SAM-dependent rRNA methyltransferase [Candidatus Rokubacteria bacterium]